MKLLLDEQDLQQWPRGREPRRSDFKPEVQAVMGLVKEVHFTVAQAQGFSVQILGGKPRKARKGVTA